MWTILGNRQLDGVRFNRQVPIGPYICDLVARSARLVIEVDGGQHASQQDRDRQRTAFLRSQGYRVLRFWNNDVLENLEGVALTIQAALNDRPSPTPSRPAGREEPRRPSRHAGGEEPRSGEGEGLSREQRTSSDMPSPSPSREAEGGPKT